MTIIHAEGRMSMTIDLSALLQEKVGHVLSNYVTEQLGDSPAAADKAISLALPSLVSGLARETGDAGKVGQLFNLITGPQIDSTVTQVTPGLLEQGHQLLYGFLGDTSALSDEVAAQAGISGANSNHLLAAAFPLVLGALRSHIQTHNMTQPQFMQLLSGQRSAAAAAGVAAAAPGAAGTVAAAAATATAAVPPATPDGSWMKWLWLALAALAAVLLLKFCNAPNSAQPPAAPASAAKAESAASGAAAGVAPAPAPAPSAAASAASAASSVADIAASAASVAAAPQSVDTGSVKYADGVLSVYFATGKTEVDKAAADAVSADIVRLGKEGRKLVVSGFNDPRGNAARNAELSKNRAKAVKEYLTAQGVPESGIELRKPAETDGKSGNLAEDRRVDVRAE